MEAYAKLVDKVSLQNKEELEKREYLITELPCRLGRANIPSNNTFSIVIDATDVLLSREHVQIAWSQDDGWKLFCLSKNGCTVDEKKYKKDENVLLHNGSDIRLGNSRLEFVLPSIAETISTVDKKRPISEVLSETDDEDEDYKIRNTCKNVDNVDNIDDGDNRDHEDDPQSANRLLDESEQQEILEQDGQDQDRRSYPHSRGYKEMIDSAFHSYELDLDEEESVLQKDLVDWVFHKYGDFLQDIKKQSLRKGMYSILIKHFERMGPDEGSLKPKRGTIRWRPKQGGSFG